MKLFPPSVGIDISNESGAFCIYRCELIENLNREFIPPCRWAPRISGFDGNRRPLFFEPGPQMRQHLDFRPSFLPQARKTNCFCFGSPPHGYPLGSHPHVLLYSFFSQESQATFSLLVHLKNCRIHSPSFSPNQPSPWCVLWLRGLSSQDDFRLEL